MIQGGRPETRRCKETECVETERGVSLSLPCTWRAGGCGQVRVPIGERSGRADRRGEQTSLQDNDCPSIEQMGVLMSPLTGSDDHKQVLVKWQKENKQTTN